MQLNEDLLKRVAKNARLELSEKEIEEFLPQLKEIVKAFSQIDEVNTEGIEPSVHPIEIKNIIREDEAGDCLSQEQALQNTEHKKDGYFKGPRAV